MTKKDKRAYLSGWGRFSRLPEGARHPFGPVSDNNTIVLNVKYDRFMLSLMDVLDLSRSEARRRLLSLLFVDPAREYHLRDLERLIGMSMGAVQNVVGKLEHEGLLKRRPLGNLALFSLNRQHPLYPEV